MACPRFYFQTTEHNFSYSVHQWLTFLYGQPVLWTSYHIKFVMYDNGPRSTAMPKDNSMMHCLASKHCHCNVCTLPYPHGWARRRTPVWKLTAWHVQTDLCGVLCAYVALWTFDILPQLATLQYWFKMVSFAVLILFCAWPSLSTTQSNLESIPPFARSLW